LTGAAAAATAMTSSADTIVTARFLILIPSSKARIEKF
jgi:hypothetical protein